MKTKYFRMVLTVKYVWTKMKSVILAGLVIQLSVSLKIKNAEEELQ
jgi:hypothetical protein